ncbi:hypothetical protein [Flavobacterium chungbukense]|uniref:Uncharacterized protein n=1 Tax=Flavobacterium chungbukense TaxID=877464 RepID=A0ABP7XSP2_9FLAO|nr:hypothetical protein [Flavobacterium chungbukense]MCC4921390.1 hypothetical protein [Flavobacterium chungbukense]
MSIRKLKIQPFENLDSFKIDMLQLLKIYEYNKNCLLDFETRLDNYLNRNKDTEIEIKIDLEKFYKSIYDKKFRTFERYKREIPENYPMGGSNMETQAYYDPIVCDDQYYKDVEKTEKDAQSELSSMLLEIEYLNSKKGISILF